MHGDKTRTYKITDTTGAFSYSPSAVTAASVATQTMTVTGGLRLGDPYTVNLPSTGTGNSALLLVHHYISATDTITLVWFNTDVVSRTPVTPSATDWYTVKVG